MNISSFFPRESYQKKKKTGNRFSSLSYKILQWIYLCETPRIGRYQTNIFYRRPPPVYMNIHIIQYALVLLHSYLSCLSTLWTFILKNINEKLNYILSGLLLRKSHFRVQCIARWVMRYEIINYITAVIVAGRFFSSFIIGVIMFYYQRFNENDV